MGGLLSNSTLQAIGQAKPATMLQDYRQGQEAIALQRQQQDVNSQQMELNKIEINKKQSEEAERMKVKQMLDQPKSVADLLGRPLQHAPKSTTTLIDKMQAAGLVDKYGVSSAGNLNNYLQANPWEAHGYISDSIAEMTADVNAKKRLVTGYWEKDEQGNPTKFIEPAKNAQLIQQEIDKTNKGIMFFYSQASELEKQLMLEEAKNDTSTTDTELFMKNPDAYKEKKEIDNSNKADMVEMDVNGEMVKVPASVAVASIDRKAQREQTAASQSENRELRKDMRNESRSMLSAYQKTNIAHQLRGEIRLNPFVKDFGDVANKYNVMETALQKAGSSPKSFVAIDQALITLYNKMTDPSSVVRESEYARTPENMSIINRIAGKIDPKTGKFFAGGAGLTNEERTSLVEMGREFYNQYATNYDQVVSDYEETAKMSGIDPQGIGIPFRKATAYKKKPTDAGTTSSGNRFTIERTK